MEHYIEGEADLPPPKDTMNLSDVTCMCKGSVKCKLDGTREGEISKYRERFCIGQFDAYRVLKNHLPYPSQIPIMIRLMFYNLNEKIDPKQKQILYGIEIFPKDVVNPYFFDNGIVIKLSTCYSLSPLSSFIKITRNDLRNSDVHETIIYDESTEPTKKTFLYFKINAVDTNDKTISITQHNMSSGLVSKFLILDPSCYIVNQATASTTYLDTEKFITHILKSGPPRKKFSEMFGEGINNIMDLIERIIEVTNNAVEQIELEQQAAAAQSSLQQIL